MAIRPETITFFRVLASCPPPANEIDAARTVATVNSHDPDNSHKIAALDDLLTERARTASGMAPGELRSVALVATLVRLDRNESALEAAQNIGRAWQDLLQEAHDDVKVAASLEKTREAIE